MSEYRRESQVLLLLNYLRGHPGLFLSIAYVLLTLCGVLYSAYFYREFDIAILKLANISDLLIAGLSEPAALLMFLGGILMAVSFDLVSQYTHRVQTKWRDKPKSLKRVLVLALAYTPKKSENVMLLVISIFVLYAFIFVSAYAEWHAKRIKDGHGNKIILSSDIIGDQAKEMTLLGSTTSFVLTFDVDNNRAIAIPIENISQLSSVMEPASPKK